MTNEHTEAGKPAPTDGSLTLRLNEHLGRLAAAYSGLNSAFCGDKMAILQFADTWRSYVARRGRRRMPCQLMRRGPRGRSRVLKARRDSLGFVKVAIDDV